MCLLTSGFATRAARSGTSIPFGITATGCLNPVHHPPGLSQGRHEEADPLFQSRLHPPHHPLVIRPGGSFDEGVHPHRRRREGPDETETLPEVVAVDIGKSHGLDDAQPAGIGNRRNQLRVGTRIHGAADEGHADAGVPGEGGVEAGGEAHVTASAWEPGSQKIPQGWSVDVNGIRRLGIRLKSHPLTAGVARRRQRDSRQAVGGWDEALTGGIRVMGFRRQLAYLRAPPSGGQRR